MGSPSTLQHTISELTGASTSKMRLTCSMTETSRSLLADSVSQQWQFYRVIDAPTTADCRFATPTRFGFVDRLPA